MIVVLFRKTFMKLAVSEPCYKLWIKSTVLPFRYIVFFGPMKTLAK